MTVESATARQLAAKHNDEKREEMDTSAGTPAQMPSADRSQAEMRSGETRQAAGALAKWWWAWLITGILWILASLVILQFRQSSVVLVGIIVGIMFLAAGVEDLVMAYLAEGWKWLWIALGIILVIAGIYALINPIQTFGAIANIIGFLFALVGFLWIIESFATKVADPLWWLRLTAGIILVVLGFWAGGQFFITQAYTLLIFAGIWAMLHGIGDIIRAFMIRQAGRLVSETTSGMTPTPAASV